MYKQRFLCWHFGAKRLQLWCVRLKLSGVLVLVIFFAPHILLFIYFIFFCCYPRSVYVRPIWQIGHHVVIYEQLAAISSSEQLTHKNIITRYPTHSTFNCEDNNRDRKKNHKIFSYTLVRTQLCRRETEQKNTPNNRMEERKCEKKNNHFPQFAWVKYPRAELQMTTSFLSQSKTFD